MKAYGKLAQFDDPITTLDTPIPKVGNNEMLVKIHAIGVGIHDEYFHAQDVDYPYVIGIEAAGVIEKIGDDVNSYKSGERITFISMMQPKGGTWAEYAVISDDSLILHLPEEMSFAEGAAFPVASNTVLKSLEEASVTAGENLFISGGAGALGTLMIQVATRRGIRVIASASEKNHAYMKTLGAESVVDYHDPDWQEQVCSIVDGGVDAAIGIHPGTPETCLPIIKDNGTLVAVSGDTFETVRDIKLKGVFNTVDVKEQLDELLQQVAEGKVKQTIGKIYQFDDALDALAQVKTRHTRGKLVIACD